MLRSLNYSIGLFSPLLLTHHIGHSQALSADQKYKVLVDGAMIEGLIRERDVISVDS